MNWRWILAAAGGVSLLSVVLLSRGEPVQAAGEAGGRSMLGNVQTGNPQLKSISRLTFGPDGLLLVADSGSASVVGIETGDRGPVVKLKSRVDNVSAVIAAGLGAPADSVQIVDMTVNPQSGKIYLSILRKTDRTPAIVTVDGAGQVANFKLDNVRYARVTLPAGEATRVGNITDVQFAGDRVLAAGQTNEEFASKIFTLPVPLVHGSSANIYSAETYHVSHRKWETRAPIQSFVPYEENGQHYIVGAFACTPIAKFPLDSLESGAKVKGISMVELGSGNRPLDMFTYEKNGQRWLVTNTLRFQAQFGPSKWWGARVRMDHLASDKTNENAVRRDTKVSAGPEGIEVVDQLFGAVQVAKLSDAEMVVLRDKEGTLALEVSELP